VFILVAYGILINLITPSKPIVMISDIISGLAVIGIAVLMFPLFKPLNKSVSLSYLFSKYLEGILMVIGGIVFLFDSTQSIKDIIYNTIHLCIFILLFAVQIRTCSKIHLDMGRFRNTCTLRIHSTQIVWCTICSNRLFFSINNY